MRIQAVLWTFFLACLYTTLRAESPQLTLNGESSVRIPAGSIYEEITATATDAEDGAINEINISYSHPSWLTREEDMVAWWRFEDDGTDETGNGNDGQLVSNAAYADGRFGRALDLPHDGSHMLIQNFNGVPIGAEFSISAWILPNDITSGGNSDGAIFSTDNTILFWVNFDAASGNGPASPTFLAGSTADNERVNGPANALHAIDWQHVVAVMDGTTRRLYVDGVLAATQNNGTTAARNMDGQDIQLGAWGGSTNMWYDGKMDEVRVYDVALEDADVANIYGVDGAGDLGGDNLDSSLLGIWTVTFAATDSDGNTGTATRTVEVYDPEAPVIQLTGELQMRVEQGTDFVEPGYTILDGEGGDPIDGAEAVVTTILDTHLAGVYLVHYDFTDGDGNLAAQVTREVTVSDTIDPTISLYEAATLKHPIGKPFIDPGAVGQDSADGELAAVSSLWAQGQLIHRGFTPGWPEQNLNFHDNGGLVASNPRGEQIFQSELSFANDADFRAAGVGIPGNDNFSNLFIGHFVANKAGEYEFGISSVDDRGTFWLDLDQDGVFEMDGDAGREWINGTYTATSGTVNLAPGIYRVAVGHLEGGGGSRVVASFKTPPGAGATSSRIINPGDADQSRFWLNESPLDTSTPGTHTITYTVTDGGGNSVSLTRTVEVLELEAQPVITLLDRPIITYAAGTDYVDPGVTLVSVNGDALDANLVKVDGHVDTSKPGEYTLTYWFYDENGIPAERVSRIVKVVDAVPPTITLEGEAEMEVILGQTFTDPGVTVTDNVDAGLVAGSTEKLPSNNLWMHLDASNIPGFSPGDTLIQWLDISGNGNHLSDVRGEPMLVADALNGMPVVRVDGDDFLAATTQVQRSYSIFTVSQLEGTDNERLLSSRDINWFLGYHQDQEDRFYAEGDVSYFNAKPATIEPHLYSATSTGSTHVRFFADGREIVEDYRRNGRIGMFQIGGYQYNTESAAGDVAEVLIYDNYVVTEEERLSIEALLSIKYDFPGYPDHTPPDLSKLGEHEILYVAQDSSGNLAFATRKVTVVPDPDLPVILLLGDSPMTVEAGSTFVDPGTKITDGAGNELVGQSATPAGTIDTSLLGVHNLVYNFAEPGLEALPVERQVVVVDTIAPVITLEGDTDILLKVGDVLEDPGFSALDQYEGDVQVVINNPSPHQDWMPGLLGGGLWGYTNLDPNPGDLGVDPIGPSLAYVLDNGPNWKERWTVVYTGQVYDEDGKIGFYENINNRAILTVGGVTLLDNDTHNQVTTQSHDFGQGGWYDFELRMGNDGGVGGMTGNIGFGISANDDGNYIQAKNSDAESMDVFRVMSLDPTQFIATEPGSYTITYTATDAHGNSSAKIRNIVVVEDDTQPYIVLNGEVEMTLEATIDATFTDLKATAKASDGTVLASDIVGEGTVDPTTPGTYQLVYRYTHTDNTVLKPVGRTIHVVDTTPPSITLSGKSTVKVFVNGTYTDAGANATDALDGNTTVLSNLEVIPGALLHEVFHHTHDNSLLDLEGNGGLLSMGPDGTAIFRNSIDFLSDQDFRDAHNGLRSNDNYQNLFRGTFTAQRDGEYQFELADINNTATIWLDKDQNGILERDGAAGDERLIWADATSLNTNIYLTKGTYPVVIAHSESGGESILTARFSAPGGAGPEILTAITPAAAEQAGVWATLPMSIDTSRPGHYKVTYYAEDQAGNLATLTRTVVVEEDLERPVITLLGENSIRQEAATDYVDPGFLLDDYQGNALDASQVVLTGVPSGEETGTFTVYYNFTDAEGHIADTRTRTVSVEDTRPPVITLLGTNPTKVQLGQSFRDPGAIAVDALDGVVTAVGTTSIFSDGLLLHLDATTFLATHQDGETITDQWPDISGQGNHANNIDGDPVFVHTGTHGQPAVNFDGDDLIWTSTDFDSLLQNYTIFGVARYTGGVSERIFSSRGRNWLFGFHTGNTGRFYAEGWVSQPSGGDTDWHHHTVTANNRDQATLWRNNTILVQDHLGMNDTSYRPRVLQLGGYESATQVSECEVSELLVYNRVLSMSEIGLIQAHLDNKYNLNGGSDFSFDGFDTSQVGEYTLSYLAFDSSGNSAEVRRTVKIVDEPDLPVILLNGDAEITHLAGEPYTDAGATIQDAQNGETPVLSGNVDILQPGTYTIAYDFTDASGNVATTVVRTVTVVDQTPPVIHLVGGDTIEHQLGNPFTDPGFSATDVVDGEVKVRSSALTKDRLRAKGFMLSNSDTHLDLADGGGLLAETPAGSTIFQSGADNLGIYFNSDTDFRSLVPEITRNDNFQFLIEGHFYTSTGGRYEFGIEYPDDRAGFWFDIDNDGKFEANGDFGSEIMNSEWIYGYRQVDLAPGFYRFAIAHREGSGGSRIDARYRAISGAGPATLTRIYPGQDLQEGQWVLYNPINVLAPGEHTITYTAIDSVGNEATVTRTVVIRNNPDAAVLTLLGDEEVTVPFGDTFTDPGVSITDLDGNAIAGAEAVVMGEVDTTQPARYILEYHYTNAAGVPARIATRKVFVVDQTPPVITLEGDAEITIAQGSTFIDPGATALDDFDGNLPVGSSESVPSDGLLLHLDASQILGKSDGDPVLAWLDISGNSNDANIANGTPTFVADSLNGRPGVHFDGRSRLATPYSFGNTYSIITVSQLTGGSDQRLLSSMDTDWALGYDNGFEDVFDMVTGRATDQLSPATTNPHIYSATSGSRQVRFFADGKDKTVYPKRRDDRYNIGKFQMGAYLDGNLPSEGDVHEVLLYDRVIGDTERMSIEARLNAKYSLNGLSGVESPVDTRLLGTYHVVYQAIDGAGNLATATRTVIVAPDPDAPVITMLGEPLVIHEAGEAYNDAGATLQDKDGNTMDASLITVDNPLDITVPGRYVITYSYAPQFEVPAPEMTREIIVQDTQPPSITLLGDKVMKLGVGETYNEPGFSATDAASGDVPVINDLAWTFGRLDRVGFMKDNATFADLDLNGNGGLLAMTPVGTSFVANGPGGRGFDFNNAGDFWGSMVDDDGNPQPGRGDQFQILYTAYFFVYTSGDYEFGVPDLDGENQIWLDRDRDGTFESFGDLGSELILAGRGTGFVSLAAGYYRFAIAYREGTQGESLEVVYSKPAAGGAFSGVRIHPADPAQIKDWAVPVPSPLDTSTPGTYTITYNATDASGLTATATRTIVVVADTSLPFIAINGESEILHEAGNPFVDPNAVVTDDSNNVLESALAGEGTVDPNTPGEYILTYKYTNAIDVVRKIIVADSTPPTVTLKPHPTFGGTDTVTFTVGSTWEDPGVDTQDHDDNPQVITDRDWIPNRLIQSGFAIPWNTENVNFENDGGFLSHEPSGTVEFTSGAFGRGWDYRSHSEFLAEPIGLSGHNNQGYGDYITGYFHARVDGDYIFATDLPGGNAAITIWIDLDQDGQFSRNGFSGDERITSASETKTTFLNAGHYRFIGGHGEGSTDSSGRMRFQTPEGAGPSSELTVIHPADPAQAGLWNLAGEGTIDTTFPGTHEITYYVFDVAGNLSVKTRTVIIKEDPDAPVLTLVGDAEIEHQIGTAYSDELPTIKKADGSVIDDQANITTTITLNKSTVLAVDGNTPGTFHVEYDYTDSNSRKAIPVRRTVIVGDFIAPVITIIGDNPLNLPPGFDYTDAGATAEDSIDGPVNVIVSGAVIDTAAEAIHTVTYTATDTAGNTSIETRTVIIKDDLNRPVITLVDGRNLIHEAGEPFVDPGASVANGRGVTFDESNIIVVGDVDHTILGDYILTYDYAMDGQTAPTMKRTVSVVDTTPPEIELTNGEKLRIPVGSTWVDPGYTVIDNLDATPTVTVLFETTGPKPVAHWSFDETDGSSAKELMNGLDGTLVNFPDPVADSWVAGKYGNALEFTAANGSHITIPGSDKLDLQTFTISAWLLIGDYNQSMFLFEKTAGNTINSQYNLYFDNDETLNFKTIGIDNSLNNTLAPSVGNLTVNQWQHVAVTYDGQNKLIYLNGELVETGTYDVELSTSPTGPSYIGAFAPGDGYFFNGLLDDLKIYDRAIPEVELPEIQKRSGIDTTDPRKDPYTLSYRSTDSSGNATEVLRKIVVSNDTTPPVITLNGLAQIELDIGDTYTEQGATATDNQDLDVISAMIEINGTVDTTKEGTYTITYDVEDLSFNAAPQVVRTVIVGTPSETDNLAQWVTDHLSGFPSDQHQELDDPDNDQLENLAEYALGGNPALADSHEFLPVVHESGGKLTVTFLRLKSSVDSKISYRVELTTSLSTPNWSDTAVDFTLHANQNGVPADYEKVNASAKTAIADEAEGKQFIRIVIDRD